MFGVSQSIIISVSVQDGLGKWKASLNAEQLISIEQVSKTWTPCEDAADGRFPIQTLYAADLVFIAACSLSKISLLLLLQQLAVSKVHLATVKVSMYIVVAWMISSLCALAFQCGLPHPWATQHKHCLNQVELSETETNQYISIMLYQAFALLGRAVSRHFKYQQLAAY